MVAHQPRERRARHGLELHFLPDLLGMPGGEAARDGATPRLLPSRLASAPVDPLRSASAFSPCSCSAPDRPDRPPRARRSGAAGPVPPGASRPGLSPVQCSASSVPCAAPRHRRPARCPIGPKSPRARAAPHQHRRAAAAGQRAEGRHVVGRAAAARSSTTTNTRPDRAMRSANTSSPASPAGPRSTAGSGWMSRRRSRSTPGTCTTPAPARSAHHLAHAQDDGLGPRARAARDRGAPGEMAAPASWS